MSNSSRDPYATLGLSAAASDAEIRVAYRRLVKQHHPDHNGGSEASERRFEEVQEAYARIRELRQGASASGRAQPPPRRDAGSRTAPPANPDAGARTAPPTDPDLEARMAALEQELRTAHEARERARRAAREASAATFRRPTDEELGYVTTDDSFTKILADARSELSDRLDGAREHPVARRVSDLIDDLEDLLSKGTGERRE
jgi:molecular chaperone DnaJ